MRSGLEYFLAYLDLKAESHRLLWEGIIQGAELHGCPVSVELEGGHDPHKLVNASCRGVMCWGKPVWLDRLPVPAINFSNSFGPLEGMGNFLNDDRAIGKMAAHHLLSRGYADYVVVSFGAKQFSIERTAGFLEALREAGVEGREIPLPAYVPPEDHTIWTPLMYLESMAEALQALLADLHPVTGIFCVDSAVVQQVEHALSTRLGELVQTVGLLSGDRSITGRWIPGERQITSTVCPASHRQGLEAMQALLTAEERGTRVNRMLKRFPPRGVAVRASTAGPACGHPPTARAIRWSWQQVQAGQPPSVEELAAHLEISARTLNRQFTRETQMTVRDFLLGLRMERAANSLAQNLDWSIERIATEAGFTKQGAFSAAFKQRIGQSPRDYRKAFAISDGT